jgi:molybdate transport system ATP-binding protein
MALDVRLDHRLGAFVLDVAFTAPPGVTALFGRSGAGKTSVVNAVAGLVAPKAGRIAVDGTVLLDSAAGIAVPRHRRRVGYVFQEARLFPHLTVRQNLGFGRWFAPRRAPRVEMGDVVELLGIGGLLERRPGALSGGEKQRVAIGRALLSAPRLLLMDEPLASLDEARKAEILPYLELLRDEVRVPIVYVSHSVAEVARLATTVVALSEGRVVRVGPAAEVLGATDLFPVVGRQEASALLPARVVGNAAEDGLSELAVAGGRLWVPALPVDAGTALRVRVRARDVMLALRPPEAISALNVLAVTVTEIGDAEGAIVEVGLDCAGDRLRARITRRSLRALALAPGRPCYAVLKSVAVGRRDIASGA